MVSLINLAFSFQKPFEVWRASYKERPEQTHLKVLTTSHSDYVGITKIKWWQQQYLYASDPRFQI